jgi:hypothetical protein
MGSLLHVLAASRPASTNPNANVFFVHGLGGDQGATWTGKAGAFWPEWLAERFPDIAVFSLGYEASPSGWLGSTMPISDRAMQTLALLESNQLLRSPAFFITHSLGGLVVKEMIRIADTYHNEAWRSLARQTSGIVFLATPHSGSRIADYLGALGSVLRLSVSVRELEANAPPLRDLNLWYRNNARRLAIKTSVFFETQNTKGVRVVDEASADPGIEGVFPIPVDADHFSICKLDSQDELQFSSVANFIQKLTSPAGSPQPALSRTATDERRTDISVNVSVNIFISYSHGAPEEVELANSLRQALAEQGYETFIDTRMIVGTDWSQEIFRKIQASDFFIVLLSENSAQSEMVQTEVRLAHQARRKDGRPVILPIRVRFDGQLDYELEAYLRRIQYTIWNGVGDTARVIGEIRQAIASGGASVERPPEKTTASPNIAEPIPPAADPSRPRVAVDKRFLRSTGGTLPDDDPYYIKRPQDDVVEEVAGFDRTTLIIRAAKQMGKSSLLLRYLAACRRKGKRVAHVDLQTLTGAELSNYQTFLQTIASSLLRRLGINSDVSKINTTLNMIYFVEDVLMPSGPSRIVIAIDEADRALASDWSRDFFSMLRAWHNRREEVDSRLKDLDIALVIATDPFLLIDDANQSPFSVGTLVTLNDFTEQQVAHLNLLYGSLLTTAQCSQLWGLFQGQPYLTRLFLYRLQSGDAMAFDDLIQHAADIDGPFGEHLRSKLLLLQRQPELVDALRAVSRGQKLNNEIIFDRLHATGLVTRQNGEITPANQVYSRFFGQL